jgi:non-heme chloroperoxidase
VPRLVVPGTEDRVLPIDATGRRLPDLVSAIRFIEIKGGPHNIGWAHPDELNKATPDFLAA